MKKEFILGLTTGVVLTGASLALANSQIQAILNNQIKVTLNGQVQEFKDETTNETQYPITYKDRTYLPLRTVANLVGVDVDYDVNSNTAMLKTKDNDKETIRKLFDMYMKKIGGYEEYRLDEIRIFSDKEKQEILNNGVAETKAGNYHDNKIWFKITYSVKPSNTDDPMKSVWTAGNGHVDGEWIVNKTGVGTWEEGMEFGFGTGW